MKFNWSDKCFVKLARLKSGVNVIGVKEIDTLQDQYSYLYISSGSLHCRLRALEYFINKKGCTAIEWLPFGVLLKNNQEGAFFNVNCSHKSGEVILDGIHEDYEHYSKNGKLAR
jgi:hypothetical protein